MGGPHRDICKLSGEDIDLTIVVVAPTHHISTNAYGATVVASGGDLFVITSSGSDLAVIIIAPA